MRFRILKKKYIISKRLLKSGTSIGANAMEVQNVESMIGFIHKMIIAAKEPEELPYWLCEHTSSFPGSRHLQLKVTDRAKVLGKNVSTLTNKLLPTG